MIWKLILAILLATAIVFGAIGYICGSMWLGAQSHNYFESHGWYEWYSTQPEHFQVAICAAPWVFCLILSLTPLCFSLLIWSKK
jgi:hypothetical protein